MDFNALKKQLKVFLRLSKNRLLNRFILIFDII